jgi:hypothetical protein
MAASQISYSWRRSAVQDGLSRLTWWWTPPLQLQRGDVTLPYLWSIMHLLWGYWYTWKGGNCWKGALPPPLTTKVSVPRAPFRGGFCYQCGFRVQRRRCTCMSLLLTAPQHWGRHQPCPVGLAMVICLTWLLKCWAWCLWPTCLVLTSIVTRLFSMLGTRPQLTAAAGTVQPIQSDGR